MILRHHGLGTCASWLMNVPAPTDAPAVMFTVWPGGLATQRPCGACVWQSVYVPADGNFASNRPTFGRWYCRPRR